ncbi:hypothetical protein EDC01DRAFT_118336 [Geopyxis carbonaria]|nr:hypothetical protein EDC01DRAFT_118336 [Geopyxis carbonaria]
MPPPPPSRLQSALNLCNSILPEPTRQRLQQQAIAFSTAQPYLASYLLLLTLFSILPLLGLVVFLFVLLSILLFWLGVALFVLSGFLLCSAALATGTWCYFVGVVLAARWVYALFAEPRDGAEPAVVDIKREQRQVAQRRRSPSPVKQEEEVQRNRSANSALRMRSAEALPPLPGANGVGAGAGVKAEKTEMETDKMRRDIARSLK